MRRVQNIFVRRGGAGDDTDDVAAGEGLDGLLDTAACLDARQRNRLETARLGSGLHDFKVEPGLGEHFRSHVPRDPAFHRGALCAAIGADKIGLRARPGTGHDVPAIGGSIGFMDHECSGCALAGRFLELVGPAAVIGHRAAVEEFRIAGAEAGVVDEDQHSLARIVGAGIIIPAELRRDRAIADEHDVCGIKGNLVGILPFGPVNCLLLEAEREVFAIRPSHDQFGIGLIDRLVHHLHFLEEGAVVAAGLQAEAGHFGGDPGSGGFARRRAGTAAFEYIICQRLDTDGEVGCSDRRRRAFRQRQQQLLCRCSGFGGRHSGVGRTGRERESGGGAKEIKAFEHVWGPSQCYV